MRVLASCGDDAIAKVYLVEWEGGKQAECAESIQAPLPREKKWVLLISTLFGCPIQCLMCDAGGSYAGKLTSGQIFQQIDFLIRQRYPDGHVPAAQFKVQLSRMGEPTMNPEVLTVLEQMPRRLDAPGLMPSLSTVAPLAGGRFLERLLEIKEELYRGGRFQLQFSLHSSEEEQRTRLIPTKTWGFEQIAEYGRRFVRAGDRKITLNFALAQGSHLRPESLRRFFSPDLFLLKITPLNPTYRAQENALQSYIDPHQLDPKDGLLSALREAGYEVIVSVGDAEENAIGSNCGQYLKRRLAQSAPLPEAYTYAIDTFPPTPSEPRKTELA